MGRFTGVSRWQLVGSAKSKVTLSAKRLNGAIQTQADVNCLEKIQFELEQAISEYEITSEEYQELVESKEELAEFAVVNGQNLSVKDTYSEAIKTLKLLHTKL